MSLAPEPVSPSAAGGNGLLSGAPSDPGELVKSTHSLEIQIQQWAPLHFNKEPGCLCAPVLRKPACQSGMR